MGLFIYSNIIGNSLAYILIENPFLLILSYLTNNFLLRDRIFNAVYAINIYLLSTNKNSFQFTSHMTHHFHNNYSIIHKLIM